jgi:hypothetical protein
LTGSFERRSLSIEWGEGEVEMLMRVLAVTAAAALIGSPALAGDKKKDKDPTQKIVCVDMQGVGSHIPDRVCKTQAEWDQEKRDAQYDIDHLGGKPNNPTGGMAPGQGTGSGPGA